MAEQPRKRRLTPRDVDPGPGMFVSLEATRVSNAVLDELPVIGSKIEVNLHLADPDRPAVADGLAIAIHRYLHEKGRDPRAVAQTVSSLGEIAAKADQLSFLLRVNRKSLRHIGHDIRRENDRSWGSFVDELNVNLTRLISACGMIEQKGRPGRKRIDELRALVGPLVELFKLTSGLAWAKTNTQATGDGGHPEYTNSGFRFVALVVAMIDPTAAKTEIDTALLTFDTPRALAKSSRVQR